MQIHRRPLCLAIGSALTLAVCGDRLAVAQTNPPTLTVLGATDGQVKILADTAQVATTLVIESVVDKAVTASVRVSPFRDSAGNLYPANIAIGVRSKADGPSTRKGTELESAEVTSLPFSLPPYGFSEVRIVS